MAKYTEPQKYDMVRLYQALTREGCVDVKGKEVQNIRALCKELGVSSQSIYRWDEKFASEIESEEKGFLECSSSNWCKAYQPIDEFNTTCNCIPCDCFIKGTQIYPKGLAELEKEYAKLTDRELYEIEYPDYPKAIKAENWLPEGIDDPYMCLPESEIETMTFKMGTTFFQTLAQGLGIKKYRMPLKQLYLNIGTELIKLSGLVENGVREELRINV